MIVLVLPDMPTEDRLLALARQGEQSAVIKIYEIYFTPVYQFIRLRVGDVAIAEDLAADVFVKLVTALRGRKGPKTSLRGWLFQVARNAINDHYGKNKRMPTTTLDEWMPAPIAETNPESQFMQTFDVQRVRRALRMLAPDQQEVIVMRFGQGLNLQETADVMGKSIPAIKSLQFRAVSTLRDVLGEFAEADND